MRQSTRHATPGSVSLFMFLRRSSASLTASQFDTSSLRLSRVDLGGQARPREPATAWNASLAAVSWASCNQIWPGAYLAAKATAAMMFQNL